MFGKVMAWTLGLGGAALLAVHAMRSGNSAAPKPATPAPLPVTARPPPAMPSATSPSWTQQAAAGVDLAKKLYDFGSSLPIWGNDDGSSDYTPDVSMDMGVDGADFYT